MEFKAYHKDLNSLHIGCEAPRAYFVPCKSESAALTFDREKSESFVNLCGEWDFKFYNSFEDIEDSFLE
ncbi:MAG: hypothetical protein J6Q67_00945, partial [Clostridia bacterium]|nr:hypothetical protein [Clostridia bacterium]